MFGTSLEAEYAALVTELGFGRAEVCELIARAAAASWLPEERRHALVAELRADPAWIA
jgi:adenosine deaminase